MNHLAHLRKTYQRDELLEASAASNPFDQFQAWLNEALKAEIPEPNAMTLSTIGLDGRPTSRIVLIKGVDGPDHAARGITWFTNYQSRKGRELATHPYACLQFHWIELERQVRIEGRVIKTTEAESDAYFQARPLESRLGAWASNQSEVIIGREHLQEQLDRYTTEFGGNVPRPPHWGGYRLIPDRFEFWQGRPSRLHDRLHYVLDQENLWQMERLAP
ncbi:pyridoxamine 5'-phosphate oxidase [Ampullimonas aquatilis]|uniref:pyridoxamine 5'-phosphate oxidase n=1 Tax=Ampullimonas aquatilis TaxID=1341549 RepID=UPI003C794966